VPAMSPSVTLPAMPMFGWAPVPVLVVEPVLELAPEPLFELLSPS